MRLRPHLHRACLSFRKNLRNRVYEGGERLPAVAAAAAASPLGADAGATFVELAVSDVEPFPAVTLPSHPQWAHTSLLLVTSVLGAITYTSLIASIFNTRIRMQQRRRP